jgi:hypothetical protein
MDVAGSKRGLPDVWTLIGLFPAAGSAMLAGRIVYESTVLTCHRGPQMVGFSMMHSGAGIVGLIALLLGLLWVLGIALAAALCRTRLSKSQMLVVAIVALSYGSLCVPYGHWVLLTAKFCSS